jgi:hypothetical protein
VKLVINDDNGRLSQAPLLAEFFHMLRLDRGGAAGAWLASLSEVQEPHVLFLHCDASSALDRFQAVVDDSKWPPLLRGVVVFNSVEFAGLKGGHERVRHEMAVRGLSATPIYVFPSSIHDNSPQEIVDQVAQFALAIRSGRSFASSTWLLDPPQGYGAALIIWALSRLVSSDACLASGTPVKAYVLQNIEEDALREIALRLEMPFVGETEQVLRDLFETLASQHPFWLTELLCPNCSVRQNTRHSLQRKSITHARQDELIDEALRMYDKPTDVQGFLARRIAHSLPLRQPEIMIPHIEIGLARLYAFGCHFAGDHAQRNAMAIRDLGRDAGREVDPTSSSLVNILRCEVYDMVADQSRDALADFGFLPSAGQSSSGKAM